MSNVDGPSESPSIIHVGPRPPSRISSTQLATPVDHLFARVRFSLPPPPHPTKKTPLGVVASPPEAVASPPEAVASPPEAVASPPKLESDDVRSLDG